MDSYLSTGSEATRFSYQHNQFFGECLPISITIIQIISMPSTAVP